MTPFRSLAFLTLLLAGAMTTAFAQEDAVTRTEESFIPNYAVASSYFTWNADSDLSGGDGSVSQEEAGIEGNVPILKRDGLMITVGAQYRWNHLSFSGLPEPLGSRSFDLHRVDLPINAWADFNDRWKLWVRLQPGWYSDFENVGSDDFILTSLVLFSYRWNDWMKVAFGGFYSKDLGEERVLPALGFIIEPDPNWSLALTFPRVELAYAPSPDWLFTGRAVLSGSGWNIADPNGGSEDIDLNYRSIRAGIGIDHRLSGPWWAYLDAGVQLGQEIEIEGGGYRFSKELDPSAFISTGVKVRF
ncbi:MAG: hypothetical protein KDN20_17365 [Verrucomicrobiae bacterium]|nr:hypothetical protein [Verrucomicrobiae bacterium]